MTKKKAKKKKGLPDFIAVQKNSVTQVQIREREFQGNKRVDAREFYTENDGKEWKPTKKGLNMTAESALEIADAIRQYAEKLRGEEEDG